MSYYRRNAVLEVGGFSEELNVMEHTDLQWKLEKAGYKMRWTTDIAHIHHRSIHRFTLSFILRNAFAYGRDWHKLHHLHPDRTGFSAFPVKIVVFVVLLFVSCFYPLILWLLFALMLSWFSFRFYRDRARVRSCVAHMENVLEKIVAVSFNFVLKILFEISQELGKLCGTISRRREKKNYTSVQQTESVYL